MYVCVCVWKEGRKEGRKHTSCGKEACVGVSTGERAATPRWLLRRSTRACTFHRAGCACGEARRVKEATCNATFEHILGVSFSPDLTLSFGPPSSTRQYLSDSVVTSAFARLSA